MTRYLSHEAFILHHRPYRETSALLTVFTKQHGRVSLVGKGSRRPATRALIQPFVLLQISFQGRTELMTLTQIEALTLPVSLKKESLLSGLYLNELLTKLLPFQDPHPDLFDAYHKALSQLSEPTMIQKTLRLFEKKLLHEFGYSIDFSMIESANTYSYLPQQGFQVSTENTRSYSGEDLLAFAKDKLETEAQLKTAKQFMRHILDELLDHKPLHVRKLFA